MSSKEQAHSNNDKARAKRQPAVEDLGLARQQTYPALIQRAKVNPRSLTPRDVLQLQRTIGNRAVEQLLTSETPHPIVSTEKIIQRQKGLKKNAKVWVVYENKLYQGKILTVYPVEYNVQINDDHFKDNDYELLTDEANVYEDKEAAEKAIKTSGESDLDEGIPPQPVTFDAIKEMSIDEVDEARSALWGWVDTHEPFGASQETNRLLENLNDRELGLTVLKEIKDKTISKKLIQDLQTHWQGNPLATELLEKLGLKFRTLHLWTRGLPPREMIVKKFKKFLGANLANVGKGEEGCEQRAHDLCLFLMHEGPYSEVWPGLGVECVEKIWIYPTNREMKLDAKFPWLHHVAVVVKTQEGEIILDPLLPEPTSQDEWATQMGRQDKHHTTMRASWEVKGLSPDPGKESGSGLVGLNL